MIRSAAVFACVLLAALPARADVTFPPPPADGTFVVDEADLITDVDEAAINDTCQRLRDEKHIPIIVVTVRSLADHQAGGLSIEAYAFQLFNEWGIGWPNWNYGMLLLVSEGDRKARIELGAAWGREHDPACKQVMDDMIIRKFKAGAFSSGIVSGVDGMTMIARDEPLPERRSSRGGGGGPGGGVGGRLRNLVQTFGGACLVIPLIVISLVIRLVRGLITGDWSSPGFWTSGGGGGGFGGGGGSSFGGGFSGGGGASGSW